MKNVCIVVRNKRKRFCGDEFEEGAKVLADGGFAIDKYLILGDNDVHEFAQTVIECKNFFDNVFLFSEEDRLAEMCGKVCELVKGTSFTGTVLEAGKKYFFCLPFGEGGAALVRSEVLPYLKEKAESFSDNIVNNSPNGIIVLNDKLEVQKINPAAMKIMNIRLSSDVLGEPVVRILDPKPFLDVIQSRRGMPAIKTYLAEYGKYVEQSIVADNEYHLLICLMRDITDEENELRRKEEICSQTADIADKVVDKQMRIVQEIASLLGETAAETKIALTKLKESIKDE